VKIATRLTILLIVLTTMVAFTVGWFAVEASTRSLYSALDAEIIAREALGIASKIDIYTNDDIIVEVAQ